MRLLLEKIRGDCGPSPCMGTTENRVSESHKRKAGTEQVKDTKNTLMKEMVRKTDAGQIRIV